MIGDARHDRAALAAEMAYGRNEPALIQSTSGYAPRSPCESPIKCVAICELIDALAEQYLNVIESGFAQNQPFADLSFDHPVGAQ